MNYLERNSRLIQEAGNHRLRKGEATGWNSRLTFYPLGSFESEELNGEKVWTGVKEPNENYYRDFITTRLIYELAIISVIAEKVPNLLPKLPLFYGLLVDKNGKPLGILTEDFSCGNTKEVWGRAIVGDELDELKEANTTAFNRILSEDDLRGLGFMVGDDGDWRLGDFFDADLIRHSDELGLPLDQVEDKLPKHTLQIDYEL